MYYVDIDVSKHHHDATVIDATGRVVITPFRFLNTRQGVTIFLNPAPNSGWYDLDLKALYQRKRLQRKHHSVVIGAVCHRLLAHIYVVLKEQRPYEIRTPDTNRSTT